MIPIRTADAFLISFFRKLALPLSRAGLFTVFFWFGILKVFGLSPASELVRSLFEKTIPVMDFSVFLVAFGLFECLIGILFVVPRMERVVMPLLFFHMATTFMPLVFLPQETWSGFLAPTLEGQYIIKNLLLIASAAGIFGHLSIMSVKRKSGA
ncbi:MAG: hypothetical protein HY482_00535 [Candidatus Wildermuthbacteria bacterium]|nr:hypothetical protein [Candidatus Wildermuthbacteria bacterium]